MRDSVSSFEKKKKTIMKMYYSNFNKMENSNTLISLYGFALLGLM